MSERGQFRNTRGPRGGGGRGGRGGAHKHSNGGGGGGAHAGGAAADKDKDKERPKKENILDLNRFMDKQMKVKFNGGREVVGTLKGFDQLMNVVLDDVKEVMRDDEGNESTRALGLIVARGTLLVLISPIDGSEEIANPFVQAEDE